LKSWIFKNFVITLKKSDD
jgi:hypothetical protein